MKKRENGVTDEYFPFDIASNGHSEIKALHGRIFATLSENEMRLYHYYMTEGRKHGITVLVDNKSFLTNRQQEEIARSGNSRVEVRQLIIGVSAKGKQFKTPNAPENK